MNYLLIDGNNLGIRASFGNSELKSSSGIPTGSHYGFFQSLINLKQRYPDYQFLVVWDSKSKRRIAEAQSGVENGLIKSGYKANRKKDERPQELINFYEQLPFLKRGLGKTGIPQIVIDGYEADDVIASYCKQLDSSNTIVAVTSDKDYFQLLDEHISIWDGLKSISITKETLIDEYKIQPHQFIDCGALSGDTSDNIFGIPSWGEKTSLKALQEHGSWEKILEIYKKQFCDLRQKFPDLINNEEEFNRLKEIQTKSGKPKYPEITIDMPFSGVTLAVEDKKTKVIPKTILLALMFEKRIKLAYSLKKMDCDISDLPEIISGQSEEKELLEYFDYYDIESLKNDIDIFCK